jgi:translation initiation factor IF-2
MAVCEQLNIIVKSHSSTITEPEAELVRVKAPQYHPKTADPRISDKKSVTTKTKELEVRTAKPQILAVTKPTVRLNNSPASGNVGAIPPLKPPNAIAEPSSENFAKTAIVIPL